LDSDSANVEKLDQQVFKLMNDLSFISNKKELIKRLAVSVQTVPASAPNSSSAARKFS